MRRQDQTFDIPFLAKVLNRGTQNKYQNNEVNRFIYVQKYTHNSRNADPKPHHLFSFCNKCEWVKFWIVQMSDKKFTLVISVVAKIFPKVIQGYTL